MARIICAAPFCTLARRLCFHISCTLRVAVAAVMPYFWEWGATAPHPLPIRVLLMPLLLAMEAPLGVVRPLPPSSTLLPLMLRVGTRGVERDEEEFVGGGSLGGPCRGGCG